jgi:hypothetical protein
VKKILLAICGQKPDQIPEFSGDMYLSVDGLLPKSIRAYKVVGTNKTCNVGPAALRNRTLKYFSENDYDSILLWDSSLPIVDMTKVQEAIERANLPFVALINLHELDTFAANEWISYKDDIHPSAIYLTREAFSKAGYINNQPRWNTLYFKRLMRLYGQCPDYLPQYTYSHMFLKEIPEYKVAKDPKYDKMVKQVWEGYDLKVESPQLPKKGEVTFGG